MRDADPWHGQGRGLFLHRTRTRCEATTPGSLASAEEGLEPKCNMLYLISRIGETCLLEVFESLRKDTSFPTAAE